MFCSKCGKEISDKAVICPHCNVPTQNMSREMMGKLERKKEEQEGREKKYNEILNKIDNIHSAEELNALIIRINLLGEYKNSEELLKKCYEKKPQIEAEDKYKTACEKLKSDNIYNVEKSIRLFNALGDYKDSKEKSKQANSLLKELEDKKARIEEEYNRKLKIRKMIIAGTIILVIALFIVFGISNGEY